MPKSITRKSKRRDKGNPKKSKVNTRNVKNVRKNKYNKYHFKPRVVSGLGECEEEKNFEVIVTTMAGESIILCSEPGDTIFDIKKAVASVLDTGIDNTFLINMEDPDHPLRDEDIIQSNLMLMVSIVEQQFYALVLYIESSQHARYIKPIYIAKSQEEAINVFHEIENRVNYVVYDNETRIDDISKGLLTILGERGKRLKSFKLGLFLTKSGDPDFVENYRRVRLNLPRLKERPIFNQEINGQVVTLSRISSTLDNIDKKIYFLVVPFKSDTELETKIYNLRRYITNMPYSGMPPDGYEIFWKLL